MRLFSFFLVLLQIRCAVIPDISMRDKDVSSVELGMIGSIKTNETSTHFVVSSIPVINEKIRITITERSFDKSSSKKYNKVQKDKDQQIVWEDSIHPHSSYLDLSIGDKVTWLNELNSQANNGVVAYLSSADEPVLIATVSISFPVDLHEELILAQEIYLVNNERKKYLLELFTDQKRIRSVELSSSLLFDYSTKDFCWIENQRHKVIIADINDTGCKKPMSEIYQKVANKKSEFKF